jgi:hypothetical protein
MTSSLGIIVLMDVTEIPNRTCGKAIWLQWASSLTSGNRTIVVCPCFQRQNYAMPSVKGDSVPHFFSLNVAKRLDVLAREENETNVKIFGDKKIIVHNFNLLHLTWHDSNEKFNTTLSGWSNNGFPDEAKGGVNLWLNGPFLSSERQTHVTHGRMVALTDMARPALEARGWEGDGLGQREHGAQLRRGYAVRWPTCGGERHEDAVSHGDALHLF